MRALLDVNVVIALLDPEHLHHEAANDWFERIADGWASCPLTQNGAIRIMAGRGYAGGAGRTSELASYVADLCDRDDHEFWSDDISLVDRRHVDRDRLGGPASLTDTYLLALARAHGGRLATFDRSVAVAAVADGRKYLEILRA